MKRLLIAFFALFGSLAQLFGMSSEQTNGKLKIGDPYSFPRRVFLSLRDNRIRYD